MVCPLVTACMRADGPYGALPLSDPAEGTPSQLCDNPTSRLPGLKAARTLRMTPNPSSPGLMGMGNGGPKAPTCGDSHALGWQRSGRQAGRLAVCGRFSSQ